MQARFRTVALIGVLMLLLVGCANTRQGVSWPAIGSIVLNGQDYILVAYEQQVELLDPSNGQIVTLRDSDGDVILDDNGNTTRWVIDGSNFENAQFFARPIQITEDNQETLLFPTYNNKLLEFNLSDARPESNAGIAISDGVIAEIVATEDVFYIPYRSGDLVALNRETLDVIWRLDTEEGIWAAPLLVDETLYVTSIDHLLYAVDANSGATLWTVDLEGAITSSPLFLNDHLYVGSYSHKMYKINLQGDIVAEHEGENWVWGTPVVYEDVLYYTDLSGNVYALDVETLSLVWEAKPATRGIRPAPLVTEDYVVVASRSGVVYWLDRATGAEIFDQELEGTPELLSDLLLIEADENAGINRDTVVVGSTDNGRLISAFALDNSALIWTYGR